MRKHWYLTIIDLCPVCLSERKSRERRYGRRPLNRVRIVKTYDWCDGI